MKLASCALSFCSIALLWTGVEPIQGEPLKLTGWFACEKCTASRVAKGDLLPSNPVCAKECIEKGSEAVFISEQGKELLKIRNYPSATEDLGFHLEVTGKIDRAAKTISIETVKRLEYEGASCARPKTKAKN